MIGKTGIDTCAPGANQSAIGRGRRLPYFLLLSALIVGGAIVTKDGGAGFPVPRRRSHAQWAHLYAALPLSFEVNQGQTDPSVNFLSRGRGYTLFLTGREAVLTLKNPSSTSGRQTPGSSGSTLRLQLLGANTHPVATGRDELPGKVNYFIGNDPSKWRRNVPTYAKVAYGWGPSDHHRRRQPAVSEAGRLPGGAVRSPRSEARSESPIASQLSPIQHRQSDNRQFIDGHYALDAQNRVHLDLGPYDHARPLIIDPVLSYATYVGGTGGDIGYAIAVDANFDAYIAGVTNSTNFPTAGAPYQSSSKGNGDAFVTKVNYEGSALLYSTYLGGSGADSATALALGSGNQVFLTGNTTSSDFPMVAPQITPGVTTYPFQDTYGGNTDAFVAQIGATGSTLFYSSYLGGNGFDSGQGIAADASGNAYVVGQTQSANFPTVSPMQLANGGASDVFVAKVNTTGTALTYSTYLGGAAVDVGQSIQVDSSGDAYIPGYTFSGNFPTVNPYQKALAGASNAFVAELNPAGSALTFSTYVGGSANDSAFGVALDGSANVYITGSTQSSDFPTTSEASQTSIRGASNAFITKLNPSGSSLVYSTYLGGSGVDQGNAIWVSSAGVAYVTGFTQSSDFPTQNPIQAVLGITNNQLCGKNPCADAFVTLLDTVKNAVVYSTYLGGNGPDFGQGIAVDSTGDPYITGSTSSTNFPSTSPPNSVSITAAPYQSSLKGEAGNAFVAKIDSGDNPNISINPYSLSFGSETLSVTSPLQQIYIVNPSTEPLDITNIQVGEVSNSVTIFTETDNCVGTLPPGGGYCIMNVAFTPGVTGSETDNITITDNAGGVAGTEQNIAVSGTGVTAATAVTVLPTSLSFTSTPVGASSAAQNVTITNTGTLPLTISSITAGTTGDFSETSASCQALNNTLNVGQSCSISVVFSPTASGTRNASLSITDNATGSPQVVALTGIGAAAFQVNFLPSTCGNSTLTNPVIIGADQTTFCVVATGAPGVTGFTGAISLRVPPAPPARSLPTPFLWAATPL